MRKIYLLITAALLLICSGTMWAGVAKVGDTEYDTFGEAVSAWSDVNSASTPLTLTLLDDCEYSTTEACIIRQSSNRTLDLNGHTLTWSSSARRNIWVYQNAVLNIEDSGEDGHLHLVNNFTTSTNSGCINVGVLSGGQHYPGTLNINGGHISFDAAKNTTYLILSQSNSYAYINSGLFTRDNTETKFLLLGKSGEVSGYFSVSGGVFDQKVGCLASGKVISRNNQGLWAVKDITDEDIVATVGETGYTSLVLAMVESSQELPAVMRKDVEDNCIITAGKAMYLDMNNHTLNGRLSIYRGDVSLFGTGFIKTETAANGTAIYLVGSTNPEAENYTVIHIGEDITVENNGGYGIAVLNVDSSHKVSYGVVVDIRGKVTASTGVCVQGNVQATEDNVPTININDGARIIEESCTGANIYAAGYGIWNIGAATLNAGTPIYAKSGVINIDGATIEACGAKADPQPNNNGFYSTGDAIIMDTNTSYAGSVLLNIYGDAKITSTNGYAIQEVITKGTTSSAAGIAISGDNTVIEGAAGSLQMTENFKDAMKDGSSETYQWVLNGIAGGVYSKVPGVVADGYVAQEVEIGGKKYYQVVVADPEAPAPASQTTYIVNDTEWDYSVEYKNSSALVITTGNTLKVKGVNVNRTSSEDVSKVTVEAGAKLIVGAEGIQTNSANGLLLKSDAVHGMGMLLYDGSTTATSPYGTAELYVSSKNLSGDERIWQHFGIPTQATPEIEKQVPASFNNWDVKKGWIWDGGSATLNAPWVGHNLSVNSDTPGQIIKFAGQLVGNEDATLALDKYGYNAFANSYTAPVNLKSIIDGAMEIDACTDGAVWMYSAAEALETGVAQFHSYGAATSEDLAIDPMQAFFILHESNASDNITVSYEEAVLGYNTRAAVANDYNTATLKITGGGEADEFTLYEGDQFSSSIDKGYDIKQMNHDFIQIYAVQNGENYASVATDDAENLELTIKTKAATQYTLSFSGISEGYGVKLTDVKSGAEIEVGNDKTYTFTADANTTAVRFRFGKSEVSADEANADAVKIWSANGSLFVEGNAAEADIEIINLSGVKVASAKASGEAVQAVSISNLASGVYVVRVGNTAAKIVK